MIHKSNLGYFGKDIYSDLDGYIPQVGDDWRDMKFDLSQDNPFADGITAEERKDRTEYLDNYWWPNVIKNCETLLGEALASISKFNS